MTRVEKTMIERGWRLASETQVVSMDGSPLEIANSVHSQRVNEPPFDRTYLFLPVKHGLSCRMQTWVKASVTEEEWKAWVAEASKGRAGE
jgi:hypothetical protein